MAGRAQISGTELKRLLDLVRDADSVELKLTLPENAREGTGAALGADPLDGQVRQVFFFDTPDLALNAAGVVVRARRRQGEEAERSSSSPGRPRRASQGAPPIARCSTSRWMRCRAVSCARRR